MKTCLLLVCVFLLASCGNDGDSDSSNSTATLKQAGIAGLWNNSSQEAGLTDEVYMYIDNSGVRQIFDYVGDGYNQGPNCYYTDPYIPQDQVIISDSGQPTLIVYTSINYTLFGEIEISITLSNGGNTMTVISPDFEDSDGDGSHTDDKVEVLTRVTNLTKDDLQPVCAPGVWP